MSDRASLEFEYESHERVRRLLDVIRYCLEGISLSFSYPTDPDSDRTDGETIPAESASSGPRDGLPYGPGAYLAVVSGPSVADHADPMGDNRWPVESCPEVLADQDAFYETLTRVARTNDGAIVVSVDGVVQEGMVRFRDRPSADAAYANWMGSRHMSALDTSTRETVVATLTLSQESGRVTVFRDGEYDSVERDRLAARWRTDDRIRTCNP